MLRPRKLKAACAAAVFAAASAGLVVLGAGSASAATTNTPLPAHVFAPYWEAYSGDDPLAESQASGDKYLTAAFLQTATKGSCTAYWNGSTSQPIAASTWGSDFATMAANGGGIIPSFGGYTADDTGTDIADSCTTVASIAAVYESVITTYNVSRIDLDIEDKSLTNSAGITRRNQAVAQVEAWAAANNRTIQFSYTLPTTTSGLASSGLAVLKNAKTNGATVSVVNLMTFDYYDGATHEMATDTENAAAGLYGQLQTLYPSLSSTQLWAMIGVTEMPGIDDYGAAETFTTADAPTVLAWAQSKGISTLAFWALERDNGGCVGTGGSDTCSGIAQNTWYFSNTFAPFTSGSTTPPPPPANSFSLALSATSGSVAAGSSATATVNTAVTSGVAQSVALTATGAPSGVTVSFSPGTVNAGSSATATFATTAATAAGTYPITVTGTSSSESQSATYTLTVTGGGTTGGGGSLVNGDFETGSLSPWTCQAGAAVQSTTVHGGKYALQVSPTAGATGECDQAVTLAPNTKYTLSGYVQGNYAFIGVSGGASASNWTSVSAWTPISVSFTTGASGAVTVFIHGWYSQGNVYADDFTLTAG